MSVFRFLLLPFAILYDVITSVRNRLYDMKLKPSASFAIPVISVGNLAVGGTGKTPMVEHLIRLLSRDYKIVTLSRGYGRKTKGFRLATATDTARTLGDEPYQMYTKFQPQVHVSVGEERALAIPTILQELPETDVIILDDAFQHRRVKPGLSILLTMFDRPFYDDHVMPYGRLREGAEGAVRADVIVVTKCPHHLDEETMMTMEHKIRTVVSKPVFFSSIRYRDPVAFGSAKEITHDVVLVTGIANSGTVYDYVKTQFNVIKHFSFRDHYPYQVSDLKQLAEFISRHQGKSLSILTTEKDKVKLESDVMAPHVAKLPFFYLPIETEFLRNGKDFDMLVLSFINSFKREE